MHREKTSRHPAGDHATGKKTQSRLFREKIPGHQTGALTNADVRSLFALEGNAKVKASRVIKDTVDAGLIKPVDPDTAPRYMRYVPFWA